MAKVYKTAGILAAKMCGESSAMDDWAGTVLGAVKAQAAKHRDTGSYIRSLGVEEIPGKRGVTDRLVFSDDPAALSIEFGHFAGKGENRTWVPGKFIMINAVEDVT